MTRDEAEALTILRCEVGSTAHGISVGNDDRDEMGVIIEPMHKAMGMSQPFEQFIYRTAAEREGHHDAPSQPGDLDLTLYGLRKYVRLACKGNPTVLTLLFAEPLECDARGAQLRELAPAIISRKAGGAYLGYMQAQRMRLTGERAKNVNRPALVAKYGFDTKFAGHMLRLGLQGVELLSTGKLTFPIADPDRSWLQAVRRGEVDLQTCLTRAGELEQEIMDLNTSDGPLRPEPDTATVEAWLVRMYFRNWSAQRSLEDQREDVVTY